MEISSSSSVQSIQKAFAAHEAKSMRIADAENNPQFVKDMAELPSDKHDIAAQLKVIKAKDEMLGALMDLTG